MTTDQLATQMWQQIKSGAALANGRLGGLGMDFSLSNDAGRITLTMSRDVLGFPLAHELEYAKRAFGVPDGAEPQFSRPWRTKPKTGRAFRPFVAQYTWLDLDRQ